MLVRPYKGIHPKIGKRVFLAETAAIIGDVEIGDDSSIWYGTVVRGDVFHIRIGARTNIQDNCTIHVTNGRWPTVIAADVSIGHGVIAHGCRIGPHCLIGMGARILDDAEIGEECLIGAGALITEGSRIPPRSLVLGMPAKVRRQLTPEEVARVRQNATNYVKYKEIYLHETDRTGRETGSEQGKEN